MPTDLLLPPSATPLERAIADATARVGEVPAPLALLWDPATCPAAVLPWLAWGLSVDSWDPSWSYLVKRQAVAQSIDLHRRKGTRAAVDTVIARFDLALSVIEWWEATPRRDPHTFQVLVGGPATAGQLAAIVREVSRVKPLREHFTIVQALRATASVGVAAFARLASYQRLVGAAQIPGA